MSSRETRLTVVIPVRDDARRLDACLQSLLAQPGGVDVPVIVADNGSKDDTPDVALRHGATLLPLPGLSVAQMRNRAVARTTTPLVGLVDADHVLAPGWLEASLDALADPTVAAAGAPYHAPTPGTWVQRAYDRFRIRPQRREDTDWLGSGNLVIRRDVFTRLGGFDEGLETCEDVDLCNRVRRSGLRLVGDPGMRSVHLGDPSTLKALFLSELWRGRDNIRVSLRGPVTLRALPSLVTPIAVLAALVLVVVGLAVTMARASVGTPVSGGAGPSMLAMGVALVTASTMLRALRMGRRNTRSLTDVLGNIAVAAVYEVARALALVVRASHGTRRRGEVSTP